MALLYHRYIPTYFNPRSPRGGATIAVPKTSARIDKISIHAPHEGERLVRSKQSSRVMLLFQSTLPTRGSDSRITVCCA